MIWAGGTWNLSGKAVAAPIWALPLAINIRPTCSHPDQLAMTTSRSGDSRPRF